MFIYTKRIIAKLYYTRYSIVNYKLWFYDVSQLYTFFQQDYRTSDSQSVLGMNIVPVFYDLKITGAGVNITVPDDGIHWSHPDIAPKFVS